MHEQTERERLDRLSNVIIGAALRVHRELGPGMLESAYQACLMFELNELGLHIEREKPLPLVYRGHRLDCGYRVDLLVENMVVVEVKAIERLERVHSAQVLSYLRQMTLKLGLLINFNVKWLRDGVKRVVNAFPE
jgi:GxxExxY protein